MNINIHQYSTTVIFYYDLNQVKLDGHFENQNHLSRSQTLITLITSYSFSIAREKHIQSHEKKKKTTALKMHIQRHQNGITHSSKIKTYTYLLQHNHFKNPSSNQIKSSIPWEHNEPFQKPISASLSGPWKGVNHCILQPWPTFGRERQEFDGKGCGGWDHLPPLEASCSPNPEV